MASNRTPREVLPSPSLIEPRKDQGTIKDSPSAQLQFNLRPYLEHREIVYAALRHAVEEGYSKQSDFADDVGRSTQEINLRLHHGDDTKGYAQLAPIDYLATLALRPAARETFLADLATAWGYRLEPLRPPTVEEKLRILAAELPEKRRRQLEREHGLPAGSLDP